LVVFNLLNLNKQKPTLSLTAVISAANANGESGGGTQTCYYYYVPIGSLPNLICTSQYECTYTYVQQVYYPDECYVPHYPIT